MTGGGGGGGGIDFADGDPNSGDGARRKKYPFWKVWGGSAVVVAGVYFTVAQCDARRVIEHYSILPQRKIIQSYDTNGDGRFGRDEIANLMRDNRLVPLSEFEKIYNSSTSQPSSSNHRPIEY